LAQTERTQIAFTEPLVHFNEDSISAADLNPELTAAGSGAAGTDMNEDTITKLIEHKTAEEEFMDIDLDDVLSLDEAESSYLFTPQKINLEADMASQIKETKRPDFKFQKKTQAVDQFETRIRRPEKS
ncbi:MAG: hypothetical protein H7256_07975, partial [Bdellovibrio sp.]|nr:hypothetical protein [Bdellovibrio sp.]